jgi:chemotaxis protein CheD
MTTLTTSNPVKDIVVDMGQIAVGQSPQRMKAIVGSCIGVVLYHRVRKTGVMAHIVLPDSAGRDGTPGKFADTAIPNMLDLLRAAGAPVHGLVAKLAGGANMFRSTGALLIGNANAEVVAKALQNAGIPVAGAEVGGTHGRRIEFDCTNGQMTIQCAGQPAHTL